ncbi:hypothetical protein RE6C_04563 [Rhodopirellula europaea 6C]|uniref:Uncharacterized protein n=1 Tax=Rhodopirellula europaea 6C TaxID=1263867 RepID=M2A4P9_9BACT|nr:hypothetical protein RE6C_04563 [Rhodopirellula europaea 6C]
MLNGVRPGSVRRRKTSAAAADGLVARLAPIAHAESTCEAGHGAIVDQAKRDFAG